MPHAFRKSYNLGVYFLFSGLELKNLFFSSGTGASCAGHTPSVANGLTPVLVVRRALKRVFGLSAIYVTQPDVNVQLQYL